MMQQIPSSDPQVIMELVRAVQADQTLQPDQKALIVEKLHDPAFTSNIAGVAGGGVALLIAKYLKLSNTAKVLLSVAGFGIGHALWNSIHEHNDKKFQDYNKKLKVYEIR